MMHYYLSMFLCLLAVLCTGQAVRAEGFSKTKVGDLDFISIQDSSGEFPTTVFLGDADLLSKLAPSGKIPNSISVFVVKNARQTVLIDTGRGRKLIENLKAAGVDPATIDAVLITHAHGDHVDGLLAGDKPNFPNAKVWIDPKELEFWKTSAKAQYEKVVSLYGEPQLIVADEKTDVVIPEIKAVPMYGHTPGHVGFLITSKGDKMFVAGDVLHGGAVQFSHPEINARFDRDAAKSAETRLAILKRAVAEGWRFAAVHLPFPSVGKVKKNTEREGSFQFEPEK
ncbi:MAG: MBL fold metallo-hydrolase [Phycisphaerales bacterium]|nr:MBL fold metallo-hydrolase [Phycisphaerales bacterium]